MKNTELATFAILDTNLTSGQVYDVSVTSVENYTRTYEQGMDSAAKAVRLSKMNLYLALKMNKVIKILSLRFC